MKIMRGVLSDYYESFGYKRLNPVEIEPESSNAHEFNGINIFKKIFGETAGKLKIPCKMIYLKDNEDEVIEEKLELTWYDARKNHPKRSEYRLYYPESNCIEEATPGDIMFLCKGKNDTITIFITQQSSTISKQLAWLFGVDEKKVTTASVAKDVNKDITIDFFTNLILEKIGVMVEPSDDAALEKIIERFPTGLPSTIEFSAFAREMTEGANPLDDVDHAFIAWLNQEEYLFRIFEKHIVEKKLDEGFCDIDEFINFSLSVHNRRKSRAGYSLENHLIQIFSCLEINFSYNKMTEKKSKPDFIFPNITKYNDYSFSPKLLTMLGVKRTCKDRWRQILTEARRIKEKHLCTLEPSISEDQTDEMKSHDVTLVVPKMIISSYNETQKKRLLCLSEFTNLIRKKQRKGCISS